jgi:hypothetical protein
MTPNRDRSGATGTETGIAIAPYRSARRSAGSLAVRQYVTTKEAFVKPFFIGCFLPCPFFSQYLQARADTPLSKSL